MLAQVLSAQGSGNGLGVKTDVKNAAGGSGMGSDTGTAKIVVGGGGASLEQAKKDEKDLEKNFMVDIRRSEIRIMKKLLRIDLSLTDGQLATFVQPKLNKILEKYNKPVTPAILASEGKKMADAINLLMVEKTR
jgi:hypothetical protein